MLKFTADLEHVHYYIAHEIVVRRAKHSAMAAVPFAVFAFLTRIASRAPDFFKIPSAAFSECASSSKFDRIRGRGAAFPHIVQHVMNEFDANVRAGRGSLAARSNCYTRADHSR